MMLEYISLYTMRTILDCMTNDDKIEESCPMCISKITGLQWTKKITLGYASVEDAQRKFNMSYEQVCDHLDTHVILRNDDGKYESDDLYLGKLLKMIAILEEKRDLINMSGEDEIVIGKALVPISKELRDNLKAVGELQGRLAESSALLNAGEAEANVLNIIDVLLTDTCPECARKITKCMRKTL